VDADRGGADERCDVHRDTARGQVIEVAGERAPRHRVVDAVLLGDEVGSHRVGQRPHRLALAEHFAGHALAHVALPARVGDQRLVGPAEHVDEPRRDGQTLDVQYFPSGPTWPDRHDAVADDADIGGERRAAAPVVDGPATQHEVTVTHGCSP
jgi:hypothetical protein